jgi:uncharacterized membrane protein
VLGFAVGGFFDGILLHQILQWHHLLSAVAAVDDMRLQVLWDGLFHSLMYVIAAAGLVGLWRVHRRGSAVGGAAFAGALLVGFGTWHIVDAVLSHWLLGIHRIRQGSENVLLWDLVWFALFGVLPVLIGLRLGRGGGTPARIRPAVMLALSAMTAGSGAWALMPPAGQPFTTVVFRPGVSPVEAYEALAALDARFIWSDRAMGVVVVDIAPERRRSLYRRGALLVTGSGMPAGCIGWSAV